MLTISFAVHLLIIIPIFISSMNRTSIIIYSPAYTVDLVSGKSSRGGMKDSQIPLSRKARKKEASALKKKLAKLKEEKAAHAKDAMAELESKLSAMKAKKSRERVSAKIRELEKKARSKKESEDLMKSIKTRIAALEGRRGSRDQGGGAKAGTDGGARGKVRGDVNMKISPQVKAYLNLLDLKVREAWIVPRALIGNRKDLMVQIRIVIGTGGELSAIFVESPSDNKLFDESVLRAIKKASPLPVPPDTLRGREGTYEVGFRFHYFPESAS